MLLLLFWFSIATEKWHKHTSKIIIAIRFYKICVVLILVHSFVLRSLFKLCIISVKNWLNSRNCWFLTFVDYFALYWIWNELPNIHKTFVNRCTWNFSFLVETYFRLLEKQIWKRIARFGYITCYYSRNLENLRKTIKRWCRNFILILCFVRVIFFWQQEVKL
jgi:hypothetical protein